MCDDDDDDDGIVFVLLFDTLWKDISFLVPFTTSYLFLVSLV